MIRHRHSGPDWPERFKLLAPLVSASATVREVNADDADRLAEIGPRVTRVRGDLTVPRSLEEARDLIDSWERMRNDVTGGLFAVLTPADGAVVGVVGLRLGDAFVAEGAAWNLPDEQARKATVDGIRLITQHAHRAMGLFRIWVLLDIDEDRYGKYLIDDAGYVAEGKVTQPDGRIAVRYSSI